MTLVAIHSTFFPEYYVSLKAAGLTMFTPSGGGRVFASTNVATYETFFLQRNDDGTVSFKSTVSNDVYIRVDGSNVSTAVHAGGQGVVNGQYTAHSWEKFRLHKKDNQSSRYQIRVGIESAAFPGSFLRLDGRTGVVNVQGVFSDYEELEIFVLG